VLKQDLLVEDVFLLDAYDNVYVWLGNEARPDEKTMAMDAALVSGHSLLLTDCTVAHYWHDTVQCP